MSNPAIADALERLAHEVETAPVRLVGAAINVRGGSGGSATGLRIDVAAGEPGTRNVGMQINVSSNDYHARAGELARELREAAKEARAGTPSKTLVRSILTRLQSLGNTALTGVITGFTEGVGGEWLNG